MNQTRTLMIIAVIFLGWMLYSAWEQDYATPPARQAVATSNQATPAASAQNDQAVPASAGTLAGSVPTPTAATGSTQASPDAQTVTPKVSNTPEMAHGKLVSVDTDLLHLTIDSHGASIVQADLKAYPVELGKDKPVRLLDDSPARLYLAQSGLVSASAAAPNHKADFSSSASSYTLDNGQDTLKVAFSWQDPSGIEVIKTYTLTRGSYVIKLEQQVVNHSGQPWTGNAYRQFQRVTPPKPEKGHMFGFSDPSRYSFFGAGWYSEENKFSKLKFDDFHDDPLKAQVKGGWLAMLQHYFFAAWIPPAGETDQYSSIVVQGPQQPHYLLRATGPAFTVKPGKSGGDQIDLFIGPKLPGLLEKVAPHLDLAVDYGKLTIISQPLHWVLSKFHALTGNWGFAIILLLLLIKGLFFKLSEAQYRSMAKMRKLQPKVKALKERYADDKRQQQQAMMDLYKKEKANPMAGCLPTLVQIPVFFALYYMLMQSVELRQAPFILWIHDLSAPDPYFVLPILNGALMLATQFLTPTTGMDPTQAKIMKIMPVAFAAMFALFPAGLVLYYCTNALISLLQMWFIMRRFEAHEAKKAA
ncbi:MAG: membrane protein insertase YidC [Rhodanobacteraceae bacterium]